MTPATLLWRQVNPAWVQQGRVTSQVFRPTRKDDRRLSVYDGDLIDAAGAWRHFTETLGHPSIGVLAVSVHECTRLDLEVLADPAPFREHVVIAFGTLQEAQLKTRAKQLKAAAEARGWQYRAGAGG